MVIVVMMIVVVVFVAVFVAVVVPIVRVFPRVVHVATAPVTVVEYAAMHRAERQGGQK